jgi:hypothetical protein
VRDGLSGCWEWELKTLDSSVDYEPYQATRAFWERMGFIQIDTIDPLPGWNPGDPAAIYVAALGRHSTGCSQHRSWVSS